MAGTRPRRRLLAVALVAVLVALAGCNAAQTGGGGAADGGQQSGAASAGGGAAEGGGGGGGSYYDDGERVIVREADMRVEVDNFTRSFQSVREVADRYGGFVGDRSQRSEGEWDRGRLTVRVPAQNFSDARDAIARLGDVEDENVRALDFTSEYQNRQQRIRRLERDRQRLRQVLNETSNATAAADLRDELQEVRQQIRELRDQQTQLRQRQALSTISVTLEEPVQRKPPRNYESAFGFMDAFTSAFYGGLTAVKYVIVFFGYAIPVGISLLALGAFLLVLWLVWQRIRFRVDRLLGNDYTTAQWRGGGQPTPGSGHGGAAGPASDQSTRDDAAGGEETGDGATDEPSGEDES